MTRVRPLLACAALLALAAIPSAPEAARTAQARGAREPERPAPEPPEVRVAAVELRLPPGEPPAAHRALVAIAPGDALRPRALRRTVQLLFQTGRFRNVVIHAGPAAPPAGATGDWVALEIECLPLRVLSSLEVRVDGAKDLPPDALRDAAGLAVGAAVEDAELEAAAERVRAAVARRGHRAARVTVTTRGERAVAVELAVEPGPATTVRSVRATGATGIGEEALVAGLRVRPGAVLDDDALAAAAREVRGRLYAAGFRRARVGEPRVVEDGGHADVLLPVEAGPRIRFVFRGQRELGAELLAQAIGIADGEPVDAPAVDAAADRLRAFYRARGHADARVEAEEVEAPGAVAIVFHVDEGPRYRLREVRVEGVSQKAPGAIRARIAARLDEEDGEPGDTSAADRARGLALSVPGAAAPPAPPSPLPASARWDEGPWTRAAETIADDYRAEGWLEAAYLGATVTLDARARTADVTLRFREGPRVSVETIAIQGNEAVGLQELIREARFAPGEPLSFARVEETRLAMLRLYLSRGHLFARIDVEEDVDRVRHVAAVRFLIAEGAPVRIGRIVVNGNRRTREDVVRGALVVSEGALYDPDAIARSQAALLRLGVFRSVNLRLQEPEVPAATKDLAVEVVERPWQTLAPGVGFSWPNGPRTFVEYGRPNLAGRALELTARAKVNYPIEPGLVGELNDRCRADDRAAGRAPGPCEWWEIVEGRAEIGVRNPRIHLADVPAAVRTDLIGERLHRSAYDLSRLSGIAGLELPFAPRVNVLVQYEAEIDQIEKVDSTGFLTQADVERLRFDQGTTMLHAIRPSIALDWRDNAAHPHRGFYLAATAEYARSISGLSDVHTNLAKLHGTASGYLPVMPGLVVATSVRGGRIYALDDRSQTIIPKRFFLGGAASMRGYAEDGMIQQDVRGELADEARHCATSLTGVGCTQRGRDLLAGKVPVSTGGQAFLLLKAELRMQVRGSMEAGLFLDLGNVWFDPRAFRLLDLRPNAGFGLRFATPIGPAALDFGFNLDRDRTLNERFYAPHFTIGLF